MIRYLAKSRSSGHPTRTRTGSPRSETSDPEHSNPSASPHRPNPGSGSDERGSKWARRQRGTRPTSVGRASHHTRPSAPNRTIGLLRAEPGRYPNPRAQRRTRIEGSSPTPATVSSAQSRAHITGVTQLPPSPNSPNLGAQRQARIDSSRSNGRFRPVSVIGRSGKLPLRTPARRTFQ
jgi:hypothetical protein